MAYFAKYKSKNPPPEIPLEYTEQVLLTDWLEIKGLLFSKTAQETFTRSWGTKMKNKASGLRKGLPDMFVVISAAKSKSGSATLLAIEMKRIKGSVTSPEQEIWNAELNQVPGVEAKICKGFEEAKNFVQSFLR